MNHIALSFSGGGFRAAGFSLGVLSYLEHLKSGGQPLLKRVRYISSASGGSITNLMYGVSIHKGRSFSDFCTRMAELMEGEEVVRQVFRNLKDRKLWEELPHKERNLINAFATVYDRYLEMETFGLFWNKEEAPHLEELCVNATEFTNGITFRFQTDGDPKQKSHIGNKYLFFRKHAEGLQTARKLKLSDILAASSCFPSGFEPMLFPGDFTHRNLSADELTRNMYLADNHLYVSEKSAEETGRPEINVPSFGLMDGGITDNQGIHSFILANNRRKGKNLPPFDLFMVCDVASHYMNAYRLPTEKKAWYRPLSITGIIRLIQVLALCSLPAIWLLYSGIATRAATVLLTLSLLCALLYLTGRFQWSGLMHRFHHTKSTWGYILSRYLGFFLDLRLTTLQQMIESRTKSVGILASDVYLKQIRRLTYQTLYDDEHLRSRTVTHFIYELSSINTANRRQNLAREDWWKGWSAEEKEKLEPGPLLTSVADKAGSMETTLWFDPRHRKEGAPEAVVAAGQFTCCYNLLRHLLQGEWRNGSLSQEEEQLKEGLLRDWDAFKADPFFMLPPGFGKHGKAGTP